MTDSMNEWVHARARSGGEVRLRIFGETEQQDAQDADAPTIPRGNAGAGTGAPPPSPKPDMNDFMRGRVRRR